LISPAAAGQRLVCLAGEHDLVGFETYLPDLAGHGRLALSPQEALALVDGFLAGIVTAKQPEDTLVVTSDHGNVEDLRTRVHTRNPVPLIAFGPAAATFGRVSAIDGLLEAMIEGLGQS
jgi:phosphopentomutase